MTREFHPVADIYPMMAEADLAALAEDIGAHGLLVPILLHPDGRVLDGRNRVLACERAGVALRFETWDGAGSAVARVVSLNEKRRQLTPAQLALVGARIANLPHGGDVYNQITDLSPERSVRQSDAAALVGTTPSAIKRGKAVLTSGVPELVEAVHDGTVSLSAADEVAGVPHDEQRKILASGRVGSWAEGRRQNRRAHPRRAKDDSRTREATRARRDRIRQLAKEGHNSTQIAAKVHLHVATVRDILKREQIPCPGDKATRHLRKHDSTRIVEQIVAEAESLTVGADLIHYKQLDPDRIPDWIARLDTARAELAALIGRLRKRRQAA